MNHAPSPRGSFLIALLIGCLALVPTARAVVPAPDGGYPGGNTAEGQNALLSLSTGTYNTAVGLFSLESNTEGQFNTAVGAGALLANVGDPSMDHGVENTATGAGALLSNTTGVRNTASGAFALFNNTEGSHNTATGEFALFRNTTGNNNTAIGQDALFSNTTGGSNTAIGENALTDNTTGIWNTATGLFALTSNTEGDGNTATGRNALQNNTTGVQNTAIGYVAGRDVTGDGNVCIGANVLGVAEVSNTTWISNVNTLTQSFSPGVNDYVTVRLSDGRLGHTQVVSSRRYKEEIKPLAAASEALYALKPVSFRLKKEYDETRALGFGLIAEEVEKVDPALVYHNNKGQVESVRYEMVNAMLLNEFLKEHNAALEERRKVEKLETTVAGLVARVKEQAAQIQRVNARLEADSRAAQIVSNEQ